MSKDAAGDVASILYPEKRFGGYSQLDGSVRFHTRVNSLLSPSSVVLDYGCGRGFHKDLFTGFARELQLLRGKVKRVIGVDFDPVARQNPYLDEFRMIESQSLPVDEGSIDLCVCEWVLEHVADVPYFFSECARVIKPGGALCVRTPNMWHYSSLGASIVPFAYHTKIRQWLGQEHSADDVFPTLYRCNTLGKCRRKLSDSGFQPFVYRHRGESHLMGSGLLLGRVGKLIETVSLPLFWHELHVFGLRRDEDLRATKKGPNGEK
ncbi:MAG: class I SAM-dependent methyltransferase [Acidobacteria bacterium]|nr:class I SAM-dependent methyltransferase [Acidobacteriota bacterium]